MFQLFAWLRRGRMNKILIFVMKYFIAKLFLPRIVIKNV